MTDTDRQRLAAILGMLGSAHAGERAAAALQAEAFRRKHGLTWGELLGETPPQAEISEPVQPQWTPPQPTPPPPPPAYASVPTPANQTWWFYLGLVFLPVVFVPWWMIIGLSDSIRWARACGPEARGDAIWCWASFFVPIALVGAILWLAN